VSAEAAFRQAADGQVDWVIAMYHDQGLAPLKLVDFGRSVNWTLGLPMIRTSVDHGTADDIAGQGIADPAAMLAAIAHAERLIR
jgi:4-hydroxy-L-threonine phosphate dehydrogenase PdxA